MRRKQGLERGRDRVREIYFVRAETMGFIKIGVTNDSARRLSSIQTFSPDRLVLMGVLVCPHWGETEAWVHNKFREHRVHGEWFRPAEELLAFIAEYALDAETAARVIFDERRQVGRPPTNTHVHRSLMLSAMARP